MGSQTLIYKEKLLKTIKEIETHLKRIDEAFDELENRYNFPLNYRVELYEILKYIKQTIR